MSNKKIRIGFIGYGNFSKLRKNILEELNSVNLVGYYDTFNKSSDLPRFDTLNDLLDKVDSVLISVPPIYAPNYVSEALSQGKDVFCEKPAAVSLDELLVVEKNLHKKSILGYGLNHRVHPSIQKIKKILEENHMGKVLWARGRYGKEVGEEYVDGWRCDYNLNGGGILIDQGIHMIDLINFLFGDMEVVSSILSNNYLNLPNVEDNAFITLANKNKKISASVHSTITQWRYIFSLEIFCQRGSIILNGLRTNSGNYGREILTISPNLHNMFYKEDVVEEFKENISWETEMRSFVESCLSKSKYKYAGYNDVKELTSLIDKVYEKSLWI